MKPDEFIDNWIGWIPAKDSGEFALQVRKLASHASSEGPAVRRDGTVYCHGCSEAGDAGMPIYHEPPVCSTSLPPTFEDPLLEQQVYDIWMKTAGEEPPHQSDEFWRKFTERLNAAIRKAAPPPTASFRTRVAELRELSEKATSGPWEDGPYTDSEYEIMGHKETHVLFMPNDLQHIRNAAFVVACVNFVRAELAGAEKLAGEQK